MDPRDRDAQVDLAIRAVRAVRAVKAATAGSRPLRTVGWSVLGTAFAATAVEISDAGQTQSAPVETAARETEAHESARVETAAHETAETHSAEAEPEHPPMAAEHPADGHNSVPLAPDQVSSAVNSGEDGSVSASTASTFHAHGHAPDGGPGTAPQGDIVVQESEQAVVTQDAQGNLVVETFTHIVVQYHGQTYVSNGQDVVTIDPRSGQDVAVREVAEVVVHENRDGSYSVSTDTHTTVALVPETDGKFEVSLTQEETFTLQEHGHHANSPGPYVTEVENADNQAGGATQLTQQESASGGADQIQNADGRGGAGISQGQSAGRGADQIQNADGRGGAGISQGQSAGAGSRSAIETHPSSSAPAAAQPTTAPAIGSSGTIAPAGTASSGTTAPTSGVTAAQGTAASAEHPMLGAVGIAATGAAATIPTASAVFDSVGHLPAHIPAVTGVPAPEKVATPFGSGTSLPIAHFQADGPPISGFATVPGDPAVPASASTVHFGADPTGVTEHFQLPAPTPTAHTADGFTTVHFGADPTGVTEHFQLPAPTPTARTADGLTTPPPAVAPDSHTAPYSALEQHVSTPQVHEPLHETVHESLHQTQELSSRSEHSASGSDTAHTDHGVSA